MEIGELADAGRGTTPKPLSNRKPLHLLGTDYLREAKSIFDPDCLLDVAPADELEVLRFGGIVSILRHK